MEHIIQIFPPNLYANTNSKFVKKTTIYFLRWFYKDFRAIFIRSNEYFDVVKSELRFSEDRIYTIPAGIDLDRFNPNFKDENLWYRVYGLPKELSISAKRSAKNFSFTNSFNFFWENHK